MNISARSLAIAFLATIAALGATEVRAQTHWQVGSGNWSDGSNWDSGLPGPGTDAYIFNGGSATVNSTADVCRTLHLGGSSEGGPSLLGITSGGLLTAGSAEYIGDGNVSSVYQTGGTNDVLGTVWLGYQSDDGYGNYNLNGGVLRLDGLSTLSDHYNFNFSSGTFQAGTGFNSNLALTISSSSGNAVFDSNGNTVTLSGQLSGSGYIQKTGAGNLVLTANEGLSSASTYITVSQGSLQINGAQLSANSEYVGGSAGGNVVMSGGNNTVAGTLQVGYNGSGTYNLNSGQVSALEVYVSTAGTFAQGGGTVYAGVGSGGLWVTGDGATYSLSAGGLYAAPEYIGYASSGNFLQTGGTHFVTGGLQLGATLGSSGSYEMQGGSLAVDSEYIGCFGIGNFSQTSGTHSVASSLYVGYGVSGSYSLGGNGLLITNSACIGYNGGGTFMQTAGTHNVQNLYLGYNASANGTYVMSGPAVLNVTGAEYIGYSGTGSSFMQSGGTHTVANSLVLGDPLFSSGSYSLNGGSLSVGNEYVGYFGIGNFSQMSGTHSVSNSLYVGYAVSGSYSLGGNGLLITNSSCIGCYSGGGTFTQTAGTHNAQDLYLGYDATANGNRSHPGE